MHYYSTYIHRHDIVKSPIRIWEKYLINAVFNIFLIYFIFDSQTLVFTFYSVNLIQHTHTHNKMFNLIV